MCVRVIPALAAILALSGCYLFHGTDADPPPPPPPVGADAGTPVEPPDDPPDDPPPPPDDPPELECPFGEGFAGGPRRIDVACLADGYAPAEEAFELTVMVETTHCGDAVVCESRIAADGVLDLYTAHCPSPDGCIQPPPLITTCTLPALPAGTWRVRVNGHDGFDLPVYDPDSLSLVDAGATCWTLAPPRPETLRDDAVCTWPGEVSLDRACHASDVRQYDGGGIVVWNDCACGNPAGACRVVAKDGVMRVSAPWRDCGSRCRDTCGGGGPEVVCRVPPDAVVGTYRVEVEGIPDASMIVVRSATEPPIGEAHEVCVGR